jgi:hypothetical protein
LFTAATHREDLLQRQPTVRDERLDDVRLAVVGEAGQVRAGCELLHVLAGQGFENLASGSHGVLLGGRSGEHAIPC